RDSARLAHSRRGAQPAFRGCQRCGDTPRTADRFRNRGPCAPTASLGVPGITRTGEDASLDALRFQRAARFTGVRMRPLTPTRLLVRCGILAAILFAVVVLALKLGAVQVSLYGLGRDLIGLLLHRTNTLSTDYGMIVLDIRLPRILLGIVVG